LVLRPGFKICGTADFSRIDGFAAGSGISTSKAIIRMRSGAKRTRKKLHWTAEKFPHDRNKPNSNDTDNSAGSAV
jgi:hypothetical protein